MNGMIHHLGGDIFMKISKVNMTDWTLPCDCCKKTIKKIKNKDGIYENYNLDDTIHEKHYKIWASSVASFIHYPSRYEKLDPESKVADLTISELDSHLEEQLNWKFGTYFHGQSKYSELWLTPRKFHYSRVNYYVSGKIDGAEGSILIELKTTWHTAKYKIKSVIEKAKLQADIYAWIAGYEEAKIIIKNLANPDLDDMIPYRPNTSNIETHLINYIEKNIDLIKKY